MHRKWLMRTAAVLGVALAASSTPSHAQRIGAVELGHFVKYTWFDSTLTVKDGLGMGARMGLFFLPNLEVEVTGAFSPRETESGRDVTHIPVHARLVYNLPMSERASVMLGGGGVYNIYDGAGFNDKGFGGLFGLRYWLAEGVSARFEAIADYMPEQDNAAEYWNWAGQAGVSVVLGHRRADSDGDGVSDSRDECPATPAGEQVDARGCALDADRDGVSDMRDRCPNTPAGEQVDANGCALDTDGDGVRNSIDRCPNTPSGTAVDANGCPPDADGDGVADAADRCPNTPRGAQVDANGCALDADRDGVPDVRDSCPNTPAGATVDAQGCPTDSDNDGVPNGIDRCPDTAANTQVDQTGCPVLFREAETRIVLEGVNFETNSAQLTAPARMILTRVGEALRGNPEVRVQVGGHTDNTGSRAYNMGLSQRRAEAVVAYLVQQGVAANQLEARGYGPDNPVADNGTREGRAQNRRVELQRLDQ